MGASPHIGGAGSPMLGGDGASFPALRSNPSAVPGIARSTRTPSDHAPSPLTPQLSGGGAQDLQRAMMQQQQQQQQQAQRIMHGINQMGRGMDGINPSWPQTQQQQAQQQAGAYAMSPPGSAGFGAAASPTGGPQWAGGAGAGAQFAYNAGSPSAGPQGQQDGGMGPVSRQTSATPAPHQQQQQQQQLAAQNNAMGDQAGLNVDFNDMFNWGQ